MGVATIREEISDERSARCWRCVTESGTGPWVNPNEKGGMCPKHYAEWERRMEAADKAYIKDLMAYYEATGDESAKTYAKIVAKEISDWKKGDRAFLRSDPRSQQRQVGFDPEKFAAWKRAQR